MSLLRELPSQNEIFLSNEFFHVACQHFPIIRERGLFEEQHVDGLTAEIYRGDFHGLLTFLKIPFKYHRIFTSFNGLKSPLDFDGVRTNVHLPDTTFIENLKKVFLVQT